MIKKIILILALIPGLVVILITAVAKRLTRGLDSESIEAFTGYLTEFKGSGEVKNLLDSEAGFIFILHEINNYSHWIITGSIIWIIVILYIIGNQRRMKNGKQEQED